MNTINSIEEKKKFLQAEKERQKEILEKKKDEFNLNKRVKYDNNSKERL